ncbi:WD40 repeat domain-containing protein [Sulfurimonas sp. SAG-AH-194-C21]|nr:WD40 repeat domain-containing protein [Sulfurimonas sp. SAG-AH-194-C21]
MALEYNKALYSYESSGSVSDMVLDKESLYVATNSGCVDIFSIRSKHMLNQICVEKIKDFMAKQSNSKVYSIDVIGAKIAILSQATKGFSRVHTYVDEKLQLLISNADELCIIKLRFLNANTLLLGLLGSEIISYDIAKKKINYRAKVSLSKFSDFALSEDKKRVVVADESGDLKILSTKDGTLEETLSGKNLDNVFQVDYKNGIIATAGKDRRVVVYDINNFSAYYKSAPFFIYSVGLSPSGNRVAYASDENNNVTLFESKSKKVLAKFGGNKMTLTKILFLNEDEFFVSSDDKVINFYRLK